MFTKMHLLASESRDVSILTTALMLMSDVGRLAVVGMTVKAERRSRHRNGNKPVTTQPPFYPALHTTQQARQATQTDRGSTNIS